MQGTQRFDGADDPAETVDIGPVALEAFEQVHGFTDRLEYGNWPIPARQPCGCER